MITSKLSGHLGWQALAQQTNNVWVVSKVRSSRDSSHILIGHHLPQRNSMDRIDVNEGEFERFSKTVVRTPESELGTGLRPHRWAVKQWHWRLLHYPSPSGEVVALNASSARRNTRVRSTLQSDASVLEAMGRVALASLPKPTGWRIQDSPAEVFDGGWNAHWRGECLLEVLRRLYNGCKTVKRPPRCMKIREA